MAPRYGSERHKMITQENLDKAERFIWKCRTVVTFAAFTIGAVQVGFAAGQLQSFRDEIDAVKEPSEEPTSAPV